MAKLSTDQTSHPRMRRRPPGGLWVHQIRSVLLLTLNMLDVSPRSMLSCIHTHDVTCSSQPHVREPYARKWNLILKINWLVENITYYVNRYDLQLLRLDTLNSKGKCFIRSVILAVDRSGGTHLTKYRFTVVLLFVGRRKYVGGARLIGET
jgi:hypothetical protein